MAKYANEIVLFESSDAQVFLPVSVMDRVSELIYFQLTMIVLSSKTRSLAFPTRTS